MIGVSATGDVYIYDGAAWNLVWKKKKKRKKKEKKKRNIKCKIK